MNNHLLGTLHTRITDYFPSYRNRQWRGLDSHYFGHTIRFIEKDLGENR